MRLGANLAETQTSDSPFLSIAGHLHRKMLERYSHIRAKAKRLAVDAIEANCMPKVVPLEGYPQIPTQSESENSE